MNWRVRTLLIAVIAVTVGSAMVLAATIPDNQVDKTKIYWGLASGFEKAAEVDYPKVVTSTPEYQELKAKKIERGTGKYWLLMTQASERAVNAIQVVGKESEFDLIAAQGYLGKLEPAISAEDVTDQVLKAMGGNQDKKGRKRT